MIKMNKIIISFKRGIKRLGLSVFIMGAFLLIAVSVFSFVVSQFDSRSHQSDDLLIFFLAGIGLFCVVAMFHPLIVVLPAGIITACLILWIIRGFFEKKQNRIHNRQP